MRIAEMDENNNLTPYALCDFDLFVGRKRQRVRKESQLIIENDYAQLYDDGPITPISQHGKLMIDGKLFASIAILPRRRYQHPAIRIIKPTRGRKRLQVKLLKKYTTLE